MSAPVATVWRMRITIESTGAGLFRMAVDDASRENLSRLEVESKVAYYLDQENRRNRVADREPWLDRQIRIPVPKWFPWRK